MRKLAWLMLLLSAMALPGCTKNTVKLYFPKGEADYLVAEQRTLARTEELERATLLALMEGPHTPGLTPPIPAGTQLLDFHMDGKVAVIDFSREVQTNHCGGSTQEMLTIYAIANTMDRLPTVERIKILVEGQEVETLLGHMDTSGEIEPDWDLVREQ